MTTIKSEIVELNKPAEKVYNYLTDFTNFEKLMPPQITNWKATTDECTFTISGMASIGLKIQDKTPHSSIVVTSFGKAPFSFSLNISIITVSADQSKGQMILEADMNPMIKMMAEKPLTNFINLLAKALKEAQF